MVKLFRQLYPYFRPYRGLFWTGFAFLILMNLIAYVLPQGIKHIWDQVFPALPEPGGMKTLVLWCGALILLALIRAVFTFFMIRCFWSTGTRLVNDLRNLLYHKLQRLSFSFYDRARTGDIMSRMTQDVEMIKSFYAYVVEHRVQVYMYLSIVVGLLLITDWKLALVCLAVTPITVWVTFKFSNKMRLAVKERQVQAGNLNATVQENITGIRVVKAFAMEDGEIAKFSRENQLMKEKNLSVSSLQTALQPFLVLCSSLGTVGILWYGGSQVIKGDITIGTFVAFMSYLALINWPLWILAPNTNQIRQVEGSAQRLLELINQDEEISPPFDGGKQQKIEGKIEFSNVTFGYNDLPVLKQVNLTINPGEKVALIGLTGSGKTTLINLIPRFYDPQAGTIKIDGQDLTTLNLEWLRRQVGIVLQETFLFSATIGDNIAFGKPEASLEEIRAAAQSAQIDDFITSLPDGYQTIVGERGVGLSGGQKQRVAIARAILLNPKILVLDDSTSSVDVETEQKIQEALKKLMAGRTTILITQRLSTAKLADRVIIMEQGVIKAQGSHRLLLAKNDFYRDLYRIQTFQDIPVSDEDEGSKFRI